MDASAHPSASRPDASSAKPDAQQPFAHPYSFNAPVSQSLFPSTTSPTFQPKSFPHSPPNPTLQPSQHHPSQQHPSAPPRPLPVTASTSSFAVSRPSPAFPSHAFSDNPRTIPSAFAPPPLPSASRVTESALPPPAPLPPPASSNAQFPARPAEPQRSTAISTNPNPPSSKPQPFPHSKSLPFPISHHPPTQSTTGQTQQPVHSAPPQTSQPQQSQTPTVQTTATSSQPYAMYDIGKLHAAQCTIIGGKVYNDKGHNICGVLNQHDKPCKRIGKCPFHGIATPVCAANSCNGVVDATGTAVPNPPSPEGASSPSPDSGSKPKVPPKKMQYKHGWTKEEHFLFLRGLEMHERGSWKQIAAVVQSRTPTQVQSHAQKYFLRQKQRDKNKRSIHDLTMDSPEMRELEKRFRNGELKNSIPSIGLSDNLYAGDGVVKREGVASNLGGGLASPQQNIGFMQNDGLGQVGGGETSMTRFAAQGNTMRFGQGQAVSATTLGSSVSSGVHVSPFPNTNQLRGQMQGGAPFLQQPDLLGHGTISTQKRLDEIGSMRQRQDVPQSRDVIMGSARPAFGQETYQTNVGNNLSTMSPKTFVRHPDPSVLTQGATHVQGPSNDQVAGQQQYSQAGFQSLYNPGGQALFTNNASRVPDNQFQWPYEGDVKKRPRDVQSGKDTLQINSLGGIGTGAIGSIGMADGFPNVGGIGTEHNVDTGAFDATTNQQTPAFAQGLFGGPDAVVVGDANSYGINAPQSGNPGNIAVSVSINGINGQNGLPAANLPLGNLPVRTPGAISNTPFVRN